MTHYEETVRNALSAEDARLYDALGRSQNPVQAAFATLSNEHRLFALGAWVFGLAMFAVAIYAVSRFFEAETTRDMIAWAAGVIVALFTLGFIKIWVFLEIQKNAVLRAVRRLELQISASTGRAR